MGVGLRSKCPDYIATINGYTGAVLQLTATADHRPISIGPLLKSSGDGITYVIYSTASSLDANGSTSNLYMASLKDVTSGRKDLVRNSLESPLFHSVGVLDQYTPSTLLHPFLCSLSKCSGPSYKEREREPFSRQIAQTLSTGLLTPSIFIFFIR